MRAFCWEMSVGPTTVPPSVYKRLAREAYAERAASLRSIGKAPVYPWQVKGAAMPKVREMQKFLTFARWGHYLQGPVSGCPATQGFKLERFTLARSILEAQSGKARDLMFVDLKTLKKGQWSIAQNFCAEGFATNGTERVPLYPLFVEKYGKDAVNERLAPSPLNPIVGQDADTIPLDMCHRFVKEAAAESTPEPALPMCGKKAAGPPRRRQSFGRADAKASGGYGSSGPIQIAGMGPPPMRPPPPGGASSSCPGPVAAATDEEVAKAILAGSLPEDCNKKDRDVEMRD